MPLKPNIPRGPLLVLAAAALGGALAMGVLLRSQAMENEQRFQQSQLLLARSLAQQVAVQIPGSTSVLAIGPDGEVLASIGAAAMDGRGQVTLSGRVEGEDLVLMVQDSGPGVSAAFRGTCSRPSRPGRAVDPAPHSKTEGGR